MIAPPDVFGSIVAVEDLPISPFLSLARTHIPAPVAEVIAAPLLFVGIWYWRRLGRASVLPIRRRIRRVSLLMASIAMIATLAATGWIDADVRPISYVSVWAIVMITLFILILSAFVDAFVSIRLHQKSVDRRLVRSTIRLRAAMERSGEDDARKEPPNA
ncbi:MAG: hypothetical protein O3A19_07145 [Planctomycetota bacterium]|jgi:hypothetical protein|nr:hypothetical protein [Planctomycetota bacterium]MDA1026190.1 hypothetical protein [Planctomycetota bacterium]